MSFHELRVRERATGARDPAAKERAAAKEALFNAPLEWEVGRPSIETELRRVESFGSDALVVACGPPSLVNECRLLAVDKGLDFRAESFQL